MLRWMVFFIVVAVALVVGVSYLLDIPLTLPSPPPVNP